MRRYGNLGLVIFAFLSACAPTSQAGAAPEKDTRPYVVPADVEAQVASKALASAVLAGGCFWCMESSLEAVPGVISVISGYSGGTAKEASYYAVGAGSTGHLEVVRVIYDPKKLSYERLLEAFWHNIDPTQGDGQFCDRGPQYRSAVFFSTPDEKRIAEDTRERASVTLGKAVVTGIVPLAGFYAAENYHQDFYKTNPEHYRAYREGCGRDRRLRTLWGQASGH